MADELRVGFIGLGTMGRGMARNLARAGFRVAVTNRTIARAHELAKEVVAEKAEARIRVCATPEEVGRESNVVVSCLPDAPEVREAHLGSAGTARGAAKGAIVIDCSTTAAEGARAVARDLATSGLEFLDAPVSGGQKGATEGTLTFFVGGEAAALERAMPVFRAMGKRVTHLGGSGAGQLGKAANQILVACNLLAVSEAKAFARSVGKTL